MAMPLVCCNNPHFSTPVTESPHESSHLKKKTEINSKNHLPKKPLKRPTFDVWVRSSPFLNPSEETALRHVLHADDLYFLCPGARLWVAVDAGRWDRLQSPMEASSLMESGSDGSALHLVWDIRRFGLQHGLSQLHLCRSVDQRSKMSMFEEFFQ
jgi:hypothetical protein